MIDHLGGVHQQTSMNRISTKKQVSMTMATDTKEVGSSQALDSLKQMRIDVEHAFNLMGEVRSRLETAYQELSK